MNIELNQAELRIIRQALMRQCDYLYSRALDMKQSAAVREYMAEREGAARALEERFDVLFDNHATEETVK